MKEIKTKNCLFKSFNIKNKNKTKKKKPAQQKFIKPKKTPKNNINKKETTTNKKQ